MATPAITSPTPTSSAAEGTWRSTRTPITVAVAGSSERIAGGSFTAVFFIQCLEAIGSHTIHLEDG